MVANPVPLSNTGLCLNYGQRNPWQVFQQFQDRGDSAAEIQRAFKHIKEGLTKVKLPSDLKVFHKATGIKEDCKLTAFSRSATHMAILHPSG